MRAMWSGEISFGLVTIPAKLYSATKDLTPQFNQLHKECGTRINLVRRCPKCARDVEYSEIGKGYEVSKGEYALFTKEELAKLEGDEAAGGVDIVEFIDPSEVDLAYIDKSYWVGPGGKSGHSFNLLREALRSSGKVALAKVRIRTRTRLAMLRPRGRLFSLDMMRFADELVADDDIVLPDGKPMTARETQLALDLVSTLTAPFDPARHPDEYRAAVEAAVDEKVAAEETKKGGGEVEEVVAKSQGGKVIDLAELLARSLNGAKGGVKKADVSAKHQADLEETKPAKKSKPTKKRASGE